ncbi:TauD/TfdA family dioxygenase [Streptomyces sp. NPDC020362]|uniref:TauD/TfdA dioxygenase family protein n=1 Tax=unclassified Streptomyces TaxID=2593676 RepID=UPI000AEC8766
MSPSIRKLKGRIDALVKGVDLAACPDPSTITSVRHALNEHKAIVFDNVNLDNAGQERVARWFGDLTTAHPNVPAADGTRNVPAVDSETSKANEWHTDVTFARRSATTPPRKEYDRGFIPTPYETEHRLVRVHRLPGERGLFIGGLAQRIVGLSSNESADLLRVLQSYVTRPENILRRTWSPDQLLILGNRITQHYGVDNLDDHPRRFNRVTVAGDVPPGVDGRRSEPLVGDASHCISVPGVAA